jgi:multidrug efflux pump subunit AcrA (membrane-fusion protein)
MMGSVRAQAGRFGVWLLLVVAALAAAAWAFWPRPLPFEVAAVVQGRFEQTIREDGRLRVRHRYVVTAPTGAELERLEFQVGDPVVAGQPIARLRPVAPQMIDTRTRAVLGRLAAPGPGLAAGRAAQQAAQTQAGSSSSAPAAWRASASCRRRPANRPNLPSSLRRWRCRRRVSGAIWPSTRWPRPGPRWRVPREAAGRAM